MDEVVQVFTKRPFSSIGMRAGFATSPGEREETYRMRYEIFSALGAHVGDPATRVDRDEFDDVCEHIVVRDGANLVATCRALTPDGAARLGQYFSSTEFDIATLVRDHKKILEIGRVCVHPAYRASRAVGMLFRAVTRLASGLQVDHLMGCTTLFERDSARVHALFALLRSMGYVDDCEVKAIHRIPDVDAATLANQAPATKWSDIVSLLRSYLQLGGRILGEPCFDPIFDSAEVLVWMPMARMPRHLFTEAPKPVDGNAISPGGPT